MFLLIRVTNLVQGERKTKFYLSFSEPPPKFRPASRTKGNANRTKYQIYLNIFEAVLIFMVTTPSKRGGSQGLNSKKMENKKDKIILFSPRFALPLPNE